MSLSLSTIETALAALVKSILTTDTAIIADQNAPRPSGIYTLIKIVDIGTAGVEASTFEDQAGPDIDLIETVEAQRDLLVSFNCFYGSAMTRANKLRLLLSSNSAVELMNAAGLGVGKVSDIREMTSVVDGLFEPRAQFDLNMYASDSEDLITLAILTAEINGEFQEGGKSIDIEIKET